MKIKELEELLEAGIESQRLEFKESCEWNINKFAKDIMALANVKGGGYIIVGIKETKDGFRREGIRKEHMDTYDIDIMKDQMIAFADPSVNFRIHKLSDKNGKNYLIIEVQEFADIPVICKKNSSDTHRATIYYRNTDGRPESAPISNSYDLRNLIELATVKMLRRKKELGFKAELSEIEKYDEELRDFDEDIIKKIKERGFWKILFRPRIYKERIKDLADCRKILERNYVLYRGWDFPHMPDELYPGDRYYEAWVDWGIHKEIWRFYQSGQFISLRGLWEDWDDEALFMRTKRYGSDRRLGVLHTIYQVTEIFEFLSGLAREGIYQEGVLVFIGLYDIYQRQLWIEDSSRVPFIVPRKTAAKYIEYDKEYSENEIKEASLDLSTEVILYIFKRFDWQPPRGLIREDQKRLLERKRERKL